MRIANKSWFAMQEFLIFAFIIAVSFWFIKDHHHAQRMLNKHEIILTKQENLYKNTDSELELMLQTKLMRLNALIDNKVFSPLEHFKKRMGDNIKMEEALFQFQQSELTALRTRVSLIEKEIKISEPLVAEGVISQLEFLRLNQSLHELKQTISHIQGALVKEAMQVKKELTQLQQSNSSMESIISCQTPINH